MLAYTVWLHGRLGLITHGELSKHVRKYKGLRDNTPVSGAVSLQNTFIPTPRLEAARAAQGRSHEEKDRMFARTWADL